MSDAQVPAMPIHCPMAQIHRGFCQLDGQFVGTSQSFGQLVNEQGKRSQHTCRSTS